MLIVKRVAGVALILLAVSFLAVGFSGDGDRAVMRSVLDSPEASGQLLGILTPVVLFGAIGLWMLLSKKPTK
jgi:succinate dehydrogenase hydrophobic anchor subunit